MPIQVKAPDGSIAQFPDGMSDDAIASVMSKEFPAPPKFDTAASDPLARSMPLPIMNRRGPVTTRNAVDMTPVLNNGQGATAAQQGDFVGRAAKTVPGWVGGAPGNIEALARLPLAMAGVASPKTLLPTSSDVTHDLFGAPKNDMEAAGERFGNMAGSVASPYLISALMRAPGAISNAMRDAEELSPTEQAAAAARDAGYVIPPNMASENPSLMAQAVSAVGGKIKTQQFASARNADATNALAARALGLPEGEQITEAALEGVRRNAGNAYTAVRSAPIDIVPDAAYHADVANIAGISADVRREFPELANNPHIDRLATTLTSRDRISPSAAVDLVRTLRDDAARNLRGAPSPEAQALGQAQRRAAAAVEGLIERNLQAATTARAPIGAEGGDMAQMVDALRNARTTIARSYDVEDALNPVTGNVDARRLAAVMARGRPLTGELQQAANMGTAFPKAVQNPAAFGGNENFGIVDLGMSALSPKAAALAVARPLARRLAHTPKLQPPGPGGAAAANQVQTLTNSPLIRALLAAQAVVPAVQPQTASVP